LRQAAYLAARTAFFAGLLSSLSRRCRCIIASLRLDHQLQGPLVVALVLSFRSKLAHQRAMGNDLFVQLPNMLFRRVEQASSAHAPSPVACRSQSAKCCEVAKIGWFEPRAVHAYRCAAISFAPSNYN